MSNGKLEDFLCNPSRSGNHKQVAINLLQNVVKENKILSKQLLKDAISCECEECVSMLLDFSKLKIDDNTSKSDLSIYKAIMLQNVPQLNSLISQGVKIRDEDLNVAIINCDVLCIHSLLYLGGFVPQNEKDLFIKLAESKEKFEDKMLCFRMLSKLLHADLQGDELNVKNILDFSMSSMGSEDYFTLIKYFLDNYYGDNFNSKFLLVANFQIYFGSEYLELCLLLHDKMTKFYLNDYENHVYNMFIDLSKIAEIVVFEYGADEPFETFIQAMHFMLTLSDAMPIKTFMDCFFQRSVFNLVNCQSKDRLKQIYEILTATSCPLHGFIDKSLSNFLDFEYYSIAYKEIYYIIAPFLAPEICDQCYNFLKQESILLPTYLSPKQLQGVGIQLLPSVTFDFSLKSQSRYAIRDSIYVKLLHTNADSGLADIKEREVNFLHNLSELPLPQSLINYLKFID